MKASSRCKKLKTGVERFVVGSCGGGERVCYTAQGSSKLQKSGGLGSICPQKRETHELSYLRVVMGGGSVYTQL